MYKLVGINRKTRPDEPEVEEAVAFFSTKGKAFCYVKNSELKRPNFRPYGTFKKRSLLWPYMTFGVYPCPKLPLNPEI